MAGKKLNTVDLNLFKVLNALIEQRNVTKAAQSLGLSQPAVSHALGRLRALFDDEMFVRTPDGMMPTQRCKKISQRVTASLSEIVDAIQPEEMFDPSTANTVVRIAMSELLTGLLPGVILPKTRSVAPNIEFRMLPARGLTQQVSSEEILTDLDKGTIDLAFTWNYEIPGRFSWLKLGDVDYVCVGAKSNVKFGRKIDQIYYETTPHVSTSTVDTDLTRFDMELAEVGASRNIKTRIPHYTGALALVAETEMIASIPRILADVARQRYDLNVSELPFASPSRSINMVWHKTRDTEPLHMWLRDFVAGCYRELEVQ
ncbi:LysR family transcriptional regulator [Ruegeria sp. 2205SS24-7]|uniref:LysR family transcriptional regulator n=1 Tax=Ruegeria discodermiae TaxID=3064389 RepID=UPI002741FEE8|nr:LysR family transcriptional regulator [Ruegeria sp. 2205SS24-7]MDP5220384.1 LysR family transcriptional regulator [Ruegeria sp. 2205SS24-7]